jgi:hypothetical protein
MYSSNGFGNGQECVAHGPARPPIQGVDGEQLFTKARRFGSRVQIALEPDIEFSTKVLPCTEMMPARLSNKQATEKIGFLAFK